MAERRGAVFDWDGVIINSGRHHEASWDRLASELGRMLPEGHFKKGFGMKNEVIIPEILNWTSDRAEITRISLRKEELYRELVVELGIAALPGVETWLQRLRAAGIPCAIGSSTHRKNIVTTLELLGIGHFFAEIVTAEDVKRGKPDPEVFLTAAKRIRVHPAHGIVFEDALVGIAAAHAGGMKAVAVTTTESRAHLAHADWIVDRLDELDVATLWGTES